jgi:hypothetical protein
MVHTQKTAQGVDGTQLWRVMPLVHRPYPLLVFLYRKEDVKTSISHQAGPPSHGRKTIRACIDFEQDSLHGEPARKCCAASGEPIGGG